MTRLKARLAVAAFGGAFILAASACDNSPAQPVDQHTAVPIVAVQGVKVTPQVLQLSAVGETKQLSATIMPVDATDRVIVWESSDTTVATVDANGRVTAKAVGVGVFVTAYTHDGHHEASTNVSVFGPGQ